MENKFLKLVKDASIDIAMKEGLKKFAKETASDVAVKLTKDSITGVANSVSNSAKVTLEDKKEVVDAYNRLSKVLISTTANFEDYLKGIEETNNMITYLNHKVASLNKLDPTFLVKKNSITSNKRKWETLKTSLSVDLTKKLSNVYKTIYRTKDESTFFEKHPKINTEIISCETEEEASKVHDSLYERYNLTYSIRLKTEDL